MGLCSSDTHGKEPVCTTGDSDEDEKKYKKLLLLGAGWSGKSTVFKQMKVLYGKGFSEEERKALRWTIFQNITQAMRILCEENKNNKYGTNDAACAKDYQAVLKYDSERDNVTLDVELGQQIKRLWATKAIRDTYDHRTEFFYPNDEVHHFFNKLDAIIKEDYVPVEDDVLRCRWISTGVKREIFTIGKVECELLDVGGQRSERKKWVRCFENVHIVLFVVAISEYDQVMYEDSESNRVLDALDLFEDICNSKWFAATNVVLFLNKIDLFDKKVASGKVPLTDYFNDYTEDPKEPVKSAREYLTNAFETRNHQERNVIVRTTCATDSQTIREVFDETIKKIVLKQDIV